MMYGIYNRLVQSFLHSCNNCILCDAEVLKEKLDGAGLESALVRVQR